MERDCINKSFDVYVFSYDLIILLITFSYMCRFYLRCWSEHYQYLSFEYFVQVIVKSIRDPNKDV